MYKILLFSIIFFLYSCNQQTIYSGKILNQDDLNNINFKNKQNLINKMGYPSFKDPIDNKFIYYSEKKIKKSIFSEEAKYSYIFVFEFDDYNMIIDTKVYDLLDNENIDIINEVTESDIIQRGLIEKIFGGVGPQTELPTSP